MHEIILTISIRSSLSTFKRLGIIERMQRVHVGGRKSVHRRRKGFPKKKNVRRGAKCRWENVGLTHNRCSLPAHTVPFSSASPSLSLVIFTPPRVLYPAIVALKRIKCSSERKNEEKVSRERGELNIQHIFHPPLVRCNSKDDRD